MSYTCYFPDGTDTVSSGGNYFPCNQTALTVGKHTSCCAPGDICFTNGLCKADTKDQYNWNWRVGCTDKTWKDPACPNYCRDVASDHSAHIVFQCEGNKDWCCSTGDPGGYARAYNFTCCKVPDLTLNLGGAVVYTHAAPVLGISSLVTSAAVISSTATPIPTSIISVPANATISNSNSLSTPTTTDSPNSNNLTSPATPSNPSSGLKIGLGVGIPLGLILIAAACFLFWRLGRQQSQQQQAKPTDKLPPDYYSPVDNRNLQRNTLAFNLEADGRELKSEMAHPASPVELEVPPPVPRKSRDS
ncbi:hypothetical protein BCR34DRAFT_90749 [Clohesyomyces aquaticus]|uniref:Mid2 domain-containing protein n=1 Tax=Clohesyomyces aquaticus TaxID=1231657 RepID=A0A1Y1YVT5_9PLEO|nr:hypothetical protein BCR34DRAFT_90749 [Clohesyomyces aquaticus]